MVSFGVRLQKLRSEKGWSQAQLAKQLGISASQIANYEIERRFPSIQVLVDMSRILGVSTDYLLGLDSETQDTLNISDLSPQEVDFIRSMVEYIRNAHQKTGTN